MVCVCPCRCTHEHASERSRGYNLSLLLGIFAVAFISARFISTKSRDSKLELLLFVPGTYIGGACPLLSSGRCQFFREPAESSWPAFRRPKEKNDAKFRVPRRPIDKFTSCHSSSCQLQQQPCREQRHLHHHRANLGSSPPVQHSTAAINAPPSLLLLHDLSLTSLPYRGHLAHPTASQRLELTSTIPSDFLECWAQNMGFPPGGPKKGLRLHGSSAHQRGDASADSSACCSNGGPAIVFY